MNNPMSSFDWTIIAAYLLAVVGLGVMAGFLRRKGERGGEGGHYFLAGNTLKWPVIGLAMFAANISTFHLVSLAEAAYKFGLVIGIHREVGAKTVTKHFAGQRKRRRLRRIPLRFRADDHASRYGSSRKSVHKHKDPCPALFGKKVYCKGTGQLEPP